MTSAAITQSVNLIAGGSNNAHVLTAAIIITARIRNGRLRKRVQGFYSFGVAYLKEELFISHNSILQCKFICTFFIIILSTIASK